MLPPKDDGQLIVHLGLVCHPLAQRTLKQGLGLGQPVLLLVYRGEARVCLAPPGKKGQGLLQHLLRLLCIPAFRAATARMS